MKKLIITFSVTAALIVLFNCSRTDPNGMAPLTPVPPPLTIGSGSESNPNDVEVLSVYSDTFTVNPFSWDNMALYVWQAHAKNMLTYRAMTSGGVSGAEGNNYLRCVTTNNNAIDNWAGGGYGSSLKIPGYINQLVATRKLSSYRNGSLQLYLRSADFNPSIEMTSPDTPETGVTWPQAGPTYGFAIDGQWHRVKIPISVFIANPQASFDITAVNYLCAFFITPSSIDNKTFDYDCVVIAPSTNWVLPLP